MKIFAVYFKIKLTKKPNWFDEFRDKFKGTFILHITLIQSRYADEAEIAPVKAKITEVLRGQHFSEEDKNMIFDEFVSSLESDGKYAYMLMAKRNDRLMAFQRALQDALKGYERYCDETTREYEVNFKPHLTLGNGVTLDQRAEADTYFSSDYACEGRVTDLVLPVVKDTTPEEANNSANLTGFKI